MKSIKILIFVISILSFLSFNESVFADDYIIHVSSYKNKALAYSEINKLRKSGFPSFIKEAYLAGETWLRLYLGPYKSHEIAKNAADNAVKKGLITYHKILSEAVNVPGVSGKFYAVHIASFQYIENAIAQMSRLDDQGLSSFMEEAQVKGKFWHRVYIGPYENIDKAKNIAQKSLRDGIISYKKIVLFKDKSTPIADLKKETDNLLGAMEDIVSNEDSPESFTEELEEDIATSPSFNLEDNEPPITVQEGNKKISVSLETSFIKFKNEKLGGFPVFSQAFIFEKASGNELGNITLTCSHDEARIHVEYKGSNYSNLCVVKSDSSRDFNAKFRGNVDEFFVIKGILEAIKSSESDRPGAVIDVARADIVIECSTDIEVEVKEVKPYKGTNPL